MAVLPALKISVLITTNTNATKGTETAMMNKRKVIL
jgi:hypothetical protein